MARTFASASNQYLQYAGSNGIGTTYNRTLAAWVKLTSTGINHTIFHHSWTGTVGTDNGYILFVQDTNKVRAYYLHVNIYTYGESTVTLSSGTWYHLAAVFAAGPGLGATATIYTNGADPQSGGDTNAISSISSNEVTTIGVFKGGSYANATIADACMWNATLTAAEVVTLAKGFSPLSVRPQSIQNYVPLIRDNNNDIVGGLAFTPSASVPTVGNHAPVMHPAKIHHVDAGSIVGHPTALRDWIKHTGRPWRPQRGL